MPVRRCTKCRKRKKGYRDRKSRKFICLSCRAARTKTCYLCEAETKPHEKIGRGVYVCEACSSSFMITGACHLCHTKGRVILRPGEKPICSACDRRPAKACSNCSTVTKFYKTNAEGRLLCSRCYEPAKRTCIECGMRKVPHALTEKGYVCTTCYKRPERQCEMCGRIAPGYKKTRAGGFLCRKCHFFVLLNEKVKQIEGSFSHPWVEKPFFEYLQGKLQVQSREQVYKSAVRDREIFETLGEHFTGPGEMSASLFWEKYHRCGRKRMSNVYAFLVEKGYVKDPDSDCTTYLKHYRVLDLIASIPGKLGETVREYYDSHLKLRKKKIEAGWKVHDFGIGSFASYEHFASILRQFSFCAIEEGCKEVAEINPDLVNDFVAKHPRYAGVMKRFVRWLHENKKITWQSEAKYCVREYPVSRCLEESAHKALIERLLGDFHPLKEAVLLLLVLVYGITPKLLRMIRVADLQEKGEDLYLALPHFEFCLDGRIAAKIRRYLDEAVFPNAFDLENPYLFAGVSYKEAMSFRSIWLILERHKVKARQIVATFVYQLYQSRSQSGSFFHPKIIERVLGVSHQTAVRYYKSYNPRALDEMAMNKELYGKPI
jgi:hypothetical protein